LANDTLIKLKKKKTAPVTFHLMKIPLEGFDSNLGMASVLIGKEMLWSDTQIEISQKNL
jgi:hypothetical protein